MSNHAASRNSCHHTRLIRIQIQSDIEVESDRWYNLIIQFKLKIQSVCFIILVLFHGLLEIKHFWHSHKVLDRNRSDCFESSIFQFKTHQSLNRQNKKKLSKNLQAPYLQQELFFLLKNFHRVVWIDLLIRLWIIYRAALNDVLARWLLPELFGCCWIWWTICWTTPLVTSPRPTVAALLSVGNDWAFSAACCCIWVFKSYRWRAKPPAICPANSMSNVQHRNVKM